MTIFPEVLLDSDTLSLYLRQSPKVVVNAQTYLRQHKKFMFSLITRFEILRGLKAINAQRRLKDFELFCLINLVLYLTEKIIVKAADVYADLYKKGQLIGYVDILIAATAHENGLAVVTNNEAHFNRIVGLQVENWNK